jgi:hypothetical protein
VDTIKEEYQPGDDKQIKKSVKRRIMSAKPTRGLQSMQKNQSLIQSEKDQFDGQIPSNMETSI